MRPCCILNKTQAILLRGSDVRTSHKPSPSARRSGMPTSYLFSATMLDVTTYRLVAPDAFFVSVVFESDASPKT